MLSETACGLLLLLLLLLLLGVLAVAPAMNTFPRLALLALGAVALLLTLLATNKTLVVLAPTVTLCFPPAVLVLWLPSGLSAALLCILIAAAATDLASRCVAV